MTPEQPRYREVRPCAALAPYVQCHWCITASAAPPFLNRICPDGCADVIIGLPAYPWPGASMGVGPLR